MNRANQTCPEVSWNCVDSSHDFECRDTSKSSCGTQKVRTRPKRTRVQVRREKLTAALDLVHFHFRSKGLFLETYQPAHKRQELPDYFVDTMLHMVTLPWIQSYLQFRMQDKLGSNIEPKFRFYVTTMPEQVWRKFKDYLTSQIEPKHRITHFTVKDRGSSCRCYKEEISYHHADHEYGRFPALVHRNWYLLRWYDSEGATVKRSQLLSVNFCYNQFNQRLRVDMTYQASRLEYSMHLGNYWRIIH